MERTTHLNTRENNASGWINGLIGVVIFSGSLPATRLAVLEFDPVFLTVARATIAALLGLCLLWLFKEKTPARSQLLPLAIVALGVVIGFPLLTALALQYVTSAHSIVFVGLLPLATAVFGVWRGGERPKLVFWLFSILGSLLVVGYAVAQGLSAAPAGDLLMLLAILVCGLGYAEGAKLSRTLGGWQVICWALVISLPATLPLGLLSWPAAPVPASAWAAFGYVAVFSMWLGFFAWYRGLALGGTVRVSQVQLVQPFLGMLFAVPLLGERLDAVSLGFGLAVMATVLAGRRMPVRGKP